MFIDRRRGDVDLRQEVHVRREKSTFPYHIALLTEGGRISRLSINIALLTGGRTHLAGYL
jgi:hypothetical protein